MTIKYPNGNVFQGQYDDEKLKQGKGKYTWSKADGVLEVSDYNLSVSISLTLVLMQRKKMRANLKNPITMMASTKTARGLVLAR